MTSVVLAKMRALPKRARAMIARGRRIPSVTTAPDSPRAWVALAEERLSELPPNAQRLIANHDLKTTNHSVVYFEPEIRAAAGLRLKELATRCNEPTIIAEAIEEIIKRKTIIQCAYAHRAGRYFSEAERVMSVQWDKGIWPIIKNENFERTLDLSCGHGRNTSLLRQAFAKGEVERQPDKPFPGAIKHAF
jgi:hypothetical protein